MWKRNFEFSHRKKVTAWQPISYQYIKVTLCLKQKKLTLYLKQKKSYSLSQTKKWHSVSNKKVTLCLKQIDSHKLSRMMLVYFFPSLSRLVVLTNQGWVGGNKKINIVIYKTSDWVCFISTLGHYIVLISFHSCGAWTSMARSPKGRGIRAA